VEDPFNLARLGPLYNEAFERDEKTLAFEVSNGRGRFLFLMFFDEDDTDTNDQLFLYLRNIKRMLRIKLYGFHPRGQFDIYIKPWQIEKIKEELGIESGGQSPFCIEKFLFNLNSLIPATLPLRAKIENLRRNWQEVRPHLPDRVVKEEHKTVLIGEKRVTNGTPKEKTLRKLYLHTEGDPDDITMLINCLKAANMTVAWTTEGNNIRSADIRDLISRVN